MPAHSAPKPADSNFNGHAFKPGASLFIVGPGTHQLEENKTALLNIELNTSAIEGHLRIELKPDTGIRLLNNSRVWEFESSGKNIHLPLQLRTGAAGRYFIHIFATEQKADGRELARALAIMIQVGEEAIRQPKPTPKVISLPAQETIR